VIPPASFVCVESPGNHEGQYIIEMITDYSAGICFVLGAAPEARFRCDGSSFQAMPKKPPKELNTPAHKSIVAPYRLEDGEWAAVLLAGEIVRPAAERGRGCTIQYEGDGRPPRDSSPPDRASWGMRNTPKGAMRCRSTRRTGASTECQSHWTCPDEEGQVTSAAFAVHD
jgi:hypothetical protein